MRNLNTTSSIRRFAAFCGFCLLFQAPESLIAEEFAGIDSESLAPTVGQVSLVIGKAFIDSANDLSNRASTGDFVREGDTIRTESSGHVHIKFVDEAVLSIRPLSELQIIAYQFDRSSPNDSSIKLNLIEGTARTVSGEGAKTARDRFRLNTPIAAIGVRGTDFVVSTTPNSLQALVNEFEDSESSSLISDSSLSLFETSSKETSVSLFSISSEEDVSTSG